MFLLNRDVIVYLSEESVITPVVSSDCGKCCYVIYIAYVLQENTQIIPVIIFVA